MDKSKSEVKIVFNTNKYIGGGETFVFEFLKVNIDYKVVCVRNSWLGKNIDIDRVLYYHKPSTLNILSYYNRWTLNRFLRKNEIKISTVLFLNFQDFSTYCNLFKLPTVINYYCLHIYDFYYRSAKNFICLISEYLLNRRTPALSKRALKNYSLINKHVNGILYFMDEINLQFHKRYISVNSKILALPCVKEQQYRHLKCSGKRILWVGRLVDFKISALNAMITYVDNNESYSLTIVGEGSEKSRLVDFSSKNRIKCIGKVDYLELNDLIQSHDIGYGMGVSSMLMASHSLPTIVGVPKYSNIDMKLENTCYGLCHELSYGDFGSQIFASDPFLRSIHEVLEEINNDYFSASKLSHGKSLEFGLSNLSIF